MRPRYVGHAQHIAWATQLRQLHTVRLLNVFQYDKAIEQSTTCLRNAQDYGFVHAVEAYRAIAFLLKGSIDQAWDTVTRFSEVPPGSQWAHLRSIVTNVVRGHIDGPEVAARALTHEMREMTSRRPQITSDVLVVYAYLAHLRRDEERCSEILDHCVPFAVYNIHNALVLRTYDLADHDEETVLEAIRTAYRDDPAVDRWLELRRAARGSWPRSSPDGLRSLSRLARFLETPRKKLPGGLPIDTRRNGVPRRFIYPDRRVLRVTYQ